ncbi:MAG: polynucleotide adenylyltransferase PcnB [Gammaproteobacteria bacterium]
MTKSLMNPTDNPVDNPGDNPGDNLGAPAASPRIIPRSEHHVSRANISRNALKVLYRLKDGGYQAYIVGGGVRDLLLKRQPKDFDIATDASPEEVRALFSNARLIGRRFRLVHVRFRDEIVEVATFRGLGNEDLESEDRQVLDAAGRIIKDNSFGSIEEDAWRRDFTINALYYNIADFSIRDFVGGMADIESGSIRLIGDPETRYREDPVRMIRAVRLAAKLDLTIHPEAALPMGTLGSLIDSVPPARLFDEFLKVFQAGHALASYRRLRVHGLFEHLFPATAAWLAADDGNDPSGGPRNRFIERALLNTDQRIADGQSVTPMFLFGVFLWGPVQERAKQLRRKASMSEVQALIDAGLEVTCEQIERITLPRRFSVPMREMLQLQPRFNRRQGRRAAVLLQHRRFRAAYDLLVLRTELGEVTPELADWWTRVQEMSPDDQRHAFHGKHRGGQGDNRSHPAEQAL